jgi:EcsC family protein
MTFSSADLKDLQYAKDLLENPSLGAKISNVIGFPIEKGFNLLPAKWSEVVNRITRDSLEKALDFSVRTMTAQSSQPSANLMHKIMAAASGAGGGAFGLAALPIELPVSTMIILRSIADIARSEGELITSPEGKLACVEVFALGGRSGSDDAATAGYFQVRAALAKVVSEAAQYIAEKGLVEESAPAVVRLIAQIASRFSMSVSQKAAAQMVPIVGAAGGAIVNLVFIDHFQDVGRGHFIVRRLERAYGQNAVRQAYDELP